ncbi:FAD-dependent oxidoreductase [Rhodocytophaga aerolata]|uniref:FAD-dependent oxidoreductase n=1 Tax=Rhodocytophaga aerolata TaxID=455078 RepID=A0ABT8RCB2_9BACT|nr:NAD(P)/FAD-dependent oxidoreductase [Rhodocytophaga aerolata]MDO1449644.1 FAD-dependent oxidoreductase [Rhodocytophaga aerolata]
MIGPFSRRSFFRKSAAALAGLTLPGMLTECAPATKLTKVAGEIKGGAASLGHKLRGEHALFKQAPSQILNYEYVIVGGGVAGLSAARWLQKNNIDSCCLLELESHVGGNAASGKNEVSSYPWGAHYLPLPNLDQEELLKFLQETEVITGFNEQGLPFYNEYHLCFDPKERLYINGYWQDSLIPHFGVPEEDQQQIATFLKLMDTYRKLQGSDGKYAFTLPVENSSQDKEFLELDQVTMLDYLLSQQLDSPYLHWYVEYCCRDDYGTALKDTSAWAGIHYFAARRGVAANAETNTVLTWPEGNGWLVKQLHKLIQSKVCTGALVYTIATEGEAVHIDFLDVKSHTTKRIQAKKCIMASPQFVNQRLLPEIPLRDQNFYSMYSYSPWVVANLTLSKPMERKGSPLSWDNVIYQSPALGYVHARHQQLNSHAAQQEKLVLTYYWPLADKDPKIARREALQKGHDEWIQLIMDDLTKAHKNIAQVVEKVDIWLWGHGMVRPTPGFIWSETRKKASMPFDNKIYFAHSDLGGVSLFEEAFYQGIRAAKEALGSIAS